MAKTEHEVKLKAKYDISAIEEGVDKVNEKLEEQGKVAKRTSAESKKDFRGLFDLFSGLLPRGLQRTVRGFSMTQRQVTRVGRSFKALRTTLASLGIPLLIMALSELIENWEKITDALGITSQAQRDTTEALNAHRDAVNSFLSTNDYYIQAINDTTLGEEQRAAALSELARTVRGIADENLNEAESLERINAAVQEQMELEGLQAEIRERQRQIEDRMQEANEQKAALLDRLGNAAHREASAQRERNEYIEENVVPLQNELNLLMADMAEAQMKVNERIEQEAEARRLAKEAEQEAARLQKEEERRLEALASLRDKLAEDAEVRRRMLGKTEEEQAIERLVIQEENELEAARQLGASNDVLLAIQEQYLDARNDLIGEQEERRQQRQAQIDEADAKKAEQEREREFQEQAKYYEQLDRLEKEMRPSPEGLEEQRQRELDDLAESYAAKLELAEGNAELTQQVQEKLREQVAGINAKYDERELSEEEAHQKEMADARQFAVNSVQSVLGTIGDLFERGSEAQKRFAVIEVLINQAKALSNAIAGASQAAAATGPGAPFVLAGYIASMVGSVIGGFAQIKNILSEAQVMGSSEVGRGGAVPQSPIRPQNPANVTRGTFKAFVVQSELQGTQNFQSDLSKRVTL